MTDTKQRADVEPDVTLMDTPGHVNCLGSCATPYHDRNHCFTDACTERTPLPVIYIHSLCGLAGITLESYDIVSLGCHLSYHVNKTSREIQWTIEVQEGTSCRAVCYNITGMHEGLHSKFHPQFDVLKLNKQNILTCYYY